MSDDGERERTRNPGGPSSHIMHGGVVAAHCGVDANGVRSILLELFVRVWALPLYIEMYETPGRGGERETHRFDQNAGPVEDFLECVGIARPQATERTQFKERTPESPVEISLPCFHVLAQPSAQERFQILQGATAMAFGHMDLHPCDRGGIHTASQRAVVERSRLGVWCCNTQWRRGQWLALILCLRVDTTAAAPPPLQVNLDTKNQRRHSGRDTQALESPRPCGCRFFGAWHSKCEGDTTGRVFPTFWGERVSVCAHPMMAKKTSAPNFLLVPPFMFDDDVRLR
jgi:hypothetical protein